MTKQRRSARGEVSLFKPDGCRTWWCRYTADGKQNRTNTGKTDKDEARRFAADVARMVGLATSDDLDTKRKLLAILQDLVSAIPELRDEAGKKLARGKAPTVRQWFNLELAEMEKPTAASDRKPVEPSTLKRISEVFDDWLAYLDGLPVPLAGAALDRITAEQVRGFLAKLKAEGLAGKTRQFAHARLRAVFGHAVNAGHLFTNPASARELEPKTGRVHFDADTNRRAFNLQQVAAVLKAAAAASEKWLYLSALLALYTGQRSSDLCAMRWQDVRDLDGALPKILLTAQKKTGAAVVIPVAEPLRAALQAVPESERAGHLLPDVVCECYAAGLKRRFQRPWRDLLDGVDLASFEEMPVVTKLERTGTRGRGRNAWTFHSWRHTTATYLSGPDAHYLLGHRTDAETKALGTTALYRHEDLLRLKKALDEIPAKLPANVIELRQGKAATA